MKYFKCLKAIFKKNMLGEYYTVVFIDCYLGIDEKNILISRHTAYQYAESARWAKFKKIILK